MRYLILMLVCLVCLLFGCTNPRVTAELDLADRLMETQPDSAYVVLKGVRGRADRAFYALLYTQAQYKNFDSIRNDSLIDIAVDYYQSNPTQERLTRAYMYKAGALSDMSRHREAIDWLKKAEQVADTADYLTLALLNLRIGELYQDSYVANEKHIYRYKSALKYAKRINRIDIEISCLGSIGQLYSRSSKDSAYFYLNLSLKLSKEVRDSLSIFHNLTILAKAYNFHREQNKAKEVLLDVLKNSNSGFDKKISRFSISLIYAHVEQVDSAKYYLNQIQSFARPADSMRYYMTYEQIAKATNDYKAAYKYSKLSNRISDSIILAGRKYELYAAEKRFDLQQVETEAVKLKTDVKTRTYLIVVSLLALMIFVGFAIAISKRKRQVSIDKIRLIDQLETEIANHQTNLKQALSQQMESIASLEKSLSERAEMEVSLKEIVEERVLIMRKLMNIKHEYGTTPSAFISHFDKVISINKKSQTEVDAVIKIANQLNDNVIERICESAPQLKPSDILLLSLACLQFTTRYISQKV